MSMSEDQQKTLAAIAATFMAPLPKDVAEAIVETHLNEVKNTAAKEELESFLQMQTPDLDIVRNIESKLEFLPADKRNEFYLVLKVLTSGWGTYLLTGSKRIVPFHDLTLEEREHALLNISRSRLSLLRGLFRALKAFTHLCAFAECTTVNGLPNPYWKPLQYVGKPEEKQLPPRSQFWVPSFEDVQSFIDDSNGGLVELETDVVVIGSGAGGSIVAAELAKAGYRVLVLERGEFHHPLDSNFAEMEEYEKQYADSVFLVTEDGSLQMLAGKTWGGGTAVNWSASLRPPQNVLDEWVHEHNLPYFGSQSYQEALDVVCMRAGISDAHIKHNIPNQNLLDGCEKLGFHAEAIPQNTNGHEHSCGFCSLGCPYGEKQGVNLTWLKDAADAGAKFISGCHVDRVTYTSDKIASGVIGTLCNGTIPISVKAKTVVSACGGVYSPALLLRSGLLNRNIGRNMHLHPVTTVHGFMPHQEVRGWVGSIMTSLCDELADFHKNGYGARMETPTSLLGATAAMLPWRGKEDFNRVLLQVPHLSGIVTIVRDHDSTIQVKIDDTGRPRVHFQLGSKDAESMLEGIIASTKILLAQGAIEVNTSHLALPPLRLLTEEDRSNPIECETTQKWFQQLRAVGISQNSISIFSAHQMASCRMSATPSSGVVNPEGETWEIHGLYVADSSIFPTASGVNPMVTTFGMGYSVAQFIKANLAKEKATGQMRQRYIPSYWEIFDQAGGKLAQRKMSRFLRAATHAGKTGVGFNIDIVLHKLTSSDPDAKELEMVYPVITRGSHKVKGQAAPILSSRQVHWTEETLSFHCTMYRTKQNTFQAKPFTVDVVKVKGDSILCTFEVDLAQYTSEKNRGTNSYSLVVQPKKAWGNASLMMSLATCLGTDKSPANASTTSSRTQNDHEAREDSEIERSSAESPPKKSQSHITSSRRMTFLAPPEDPPCSEDPDEEVERPSSVSFAAQIIKYDRANKELQSKLDATLVELQQAKEVSNSSTDSAKTWQQKYDTLVASQGSLQEELQSLKEKKARAEKEVVLRRTELQNSVESSSRVNVVQLERIRHLTTLNEELKGKIQELMLAVEKQPPKSPLRTVASWSEGVGHVNPVDADLQKYTAPPPVEPASNSVASEVVRLQGENKILEERVEGLQHEVEGLENQLFERSSELQHVLELHAHCNTMISVKSNELRNAHEEILRLQSNMSTMEASSEAEHLVGMLQRNLEEMQDEVNSLQTKNNQLREAKGKIEAELCKRLAELKRGKSEVDLISPSQYEELTQVNRKQAEKLHELQNTTENLQLELVKAKENKPIQVRSVLDTHFPTQMEVGAIEQARQLSKQTSSATIAKDSEVGYLKQQVRELREQKDRIQDELNEKSVELQRALDMHTRMQRDSVQQLTDVEAQLEAEGHRVLVLQAQITCMEKENLKWSEEKQRIESMLTAEQAEKKLQQEALESLRKVNEEVVIARIEEANAMHKADLMSLKSDMEATVEENDQLKSEIKDILAKSCSENGDASALRSQVQDLKLQIQHLQYELSEKSDEVEKLVQVQQNEAPLTASLQSALDSKTEECVELSTKLSECQALVEKLKEKLVGVDEGPNEEMERLLQQRTDEWMAAKDELAKCSWELDQLKSKQSDVNETIPADDTATKHVENEFKFAKDQLTSCEFELEKLKIVNRDLVAKIDELEEKLNTSSTSIEGYEQIKNENEYFQNELIETKLKLAVIQEKHDDLIAEHKKIEKELLLIKIQSAETALKANKKK